MLFNVLELDLSLFFVGPVSSDWARLRILVTAVADMTIDGFSSR